MAITTNFDEWLDLSGPKECKEAYLLYQAVSNEQSNGIWIPSRKNGYLFVRIDHTDETLVITSSEAKQVFLSMICEKFCLQVLSHP